jgi:hypothetical protein
MRPLPLPRPAASQPVTQFKSSPVLAFLAFYRDSPKMEANMSVAYYGEEWPAARHLAPSLGLSVFGPCSGFVSEHSDSRLSNLVSRGRFINFTPSSTKFGQPRASFFEAPASACDSQLGMVDFCTDHQFLFITSRQVLLMSHYQASWSSQQATTFDNSPTVYK